MHPAILVGAGFLAGTAGIKAVTSQSARKLYVRGIVSGLKAKEQCETLVEDAKAEFDDLMAEAEFEAKDTADVAEEASAEQE